jgi:transcriptional regulator with XRE-family HTH domain
LELFSHIVMTTQMLERTTGELIRQAREAAGISQRELARRSGILQPMLSRIENGLQQPCLNTLRTIAQALGVNYRDLLP